MVLFTRLHRDAGSTEHRERKREQILLELLITDIPPYKLDNKCRCLEPKISGFCNKVGGSALPR